jgi:broad specificity phosphatase PhoE
MSVWLIRHGATTAPSGIAAGATDRPLSSQGLAQARALGDRLAGRPLTRLFASDLARAVQTAAEIARRHDLRIEITPALREIDFGSWEGRSLTELWSEEPTAAAAWEADMRSTPATFGESFADLEARVTRWWDGIRDSLHGEIGVVAHGGSLAVLHSLITGETIEMRFELGQALEVVSAWGGCLLSPTCRPLEQLDSCQVKPGGLWSQGRRFCG